LQPGRSDPAFIALLLITKTAPPAFQFSGGARNCTYPRSDPRRRAQNAQLAHEGCKARFALIRQMASKFKAFLDHPAGPKTVFFWAPTMKWGLVIAGLADINRPPEKISTGQQCALAATGFIWARCETLCPLDASAHSVTFISQMQLKSFPRT
jgi:hypothetical protein